MDTQAINIIETQTKLFEIQEWIKADYNAPVLRGDLHDLLAVCINALQAAAATNTTTGGV